MKIATFNVNSVRARLEILQRWLIDSKPDLLFLQETKTQDDFFPELFFDELNYKSYFHGEKSYNGVAAIVKKNICEYGNISVNFGFNDGLDENNFDTRVLDCKLKIANLNLEILNTYVPQGKEITHQDFQVKKKFFARVRNFLEREDRLNEKFLWLGDLNVAAENIDVTNPQNKLEHVCFYHEIREIFAKTKSGLVDLLRKFHGDQEIYTFYDYRVKNALQRKIGWRIDYIFASEKFSECARSCEVDINPRIWERPSDHVPVIAEFIVI